MTVSALLAHEYYTSSSRSSVSRLVGPNQTPPSSLDWTDASSVSFASEAPTPIKHCQTLPSARQDLAKRLPLAWRPADWSRSSDNGHHNNGGNSSSAGGQAADVTARIYSFTSSAESSAEEVARRQQENKRTRRRQERCVGAAGRKDSFRNRRSAERDEAEKLLTSQLATARAQLEQREVVTRSLQRQLDQV